VRKLKKVLCMPAGDWVLLLRAASCLLVCRVGVYLLRFDRLQWWATRAGRINRSLPISKLIWAVMIGARVLPNSTCLVRALAASRLLAQNGYKSTIHIGVKRTDGVFEAHAWIEYGGHVILGSHEAPYFTRLYSWESKPGGL